MQCVKVIKIAFIFIDFISNYVLKYNTQTCGDMGITEFKVKNNFKISKIIPNASYYKLYYMEYKRFHPLINRIDNEWGILILAFSQPFINDTAITYRIEYFTANRYFESDHLNFYSEFTINNSESNVLVNGFLMHPSTPITSANLTNSLTLCDHNVFHNINLAPIFMYVIIHENFLHLYSCIKDYHWVTINESISCSQSYHLIEWIFVRIESPEVNITLISKIYDKPFKIFAVITTSIIFNIFLIGLKYIDVKILGN